jgi:hypothetical protein
MGLYSTLIQPFGYLSVTPPFSIVEMMDKKINDLLSFSVFFLINELVGLKFHCELETWDYVFTKGTIQIHSVTVE